VARHLDRITAAVRSGQYKVFVDQYARPVAYVSWARVDPTTNSALLRNGPDALGVGWASGSTAWVIDLFAHEGSLPRVMTFLRDEVFVDEEAVAYFRMRRQRRLVKQLSRTDRTTFMRSTSSREWGGLVDDVHLLRPLGEILVTRQELGLAVEALRYAPQRDCGIGSEPGCINLLQTMRLTRTYRGADGSANGLLAWAWFTDEGLQRLRSRTPLDLHPSEWNEGTRLCFWSLHAHHDVIDAVIADLIAGLFPQESEVWLFRAHGATRLQRVIRKRGGPAFHDWCRVSNKKTADFGAETAI